MTFRKWLLKTIKVFADPGVLPADVHSVAWQFMSSSFRNEPSCRVDPLFIELYLFAVWSFDAFVVNYHPAWQVFCMSLSFAFPEVAEDAQLRMELLRNPLLSEHEQRVCNVRSALLSLIRYSKRLLSQWINADKVAFLEGVAGGVGEALSIGASREAWQKIKCLLAWGGKKRKPRPHARKCVDGSVAQSFVEIANTIQGHFAAVECAKFMSLENLAQQHNNRPAIGTVVGIPVMVQRQISLSQAVQNSFVHHSDSVVDVPVIVQRCVPQNSDRVVDVPYCGDKCQFSKTA